MAWQLVDDFLFFFSGFPKWQLNLKDSKFWSQRNQPTSNLQRDVLDWLAKLGSSATTAPELIRFRLKV